MTTVSERITPSDRLRRSRLDRREAMRLAAVEYERFADAVSQVGADGWGRPTDCPAWDVRRLACHVVGMAELAADPAEGDRQRRLAGLAVADSGGDFTDALTALQVAERESWGPADILARVRDAGRRAAVGRASAPAQALGAAMPSPFEFNGQLERWSVGYLFDTILTRDVWMHRIDLCTAVGIPVLLTADHDGVIVSDLVDEWAQRHARPYRLTLTGTAGGRFAGATGGQDQEWHDELDAIEFARILAGRGTGTGLLAIRVPF